MEIKSNVSLLPYNTFGIDVACRSFVEIKTIDELLELQSTSQFKDNQRLMLGGGSNLLFTNDFDGLVVKNSMRGMEVVKEEKNYVLVKANAGEVWHEFVLWCIENGYAGVENLSLIPGQVGASPMQNIGAYGVEIKDVCASVEAIHLLTGERVTFTNNECAFGYRESVFKHKNAGEFMITSVTYCLTKEPHFRIDYGDIKQTLADMQVFDLTLKAVSDAVIKIRSSKLPNPKVLGNAGSFFKNPVVSHQKAEELLNRNPVMPNYPVQDGVKIPAGWLIEQCGWKGKVVGNTGAHKSQALVLVNYGNATGNEIYQLALDIKQSVLDKFGVEINPEVNVV